MISKNSPQLDFDGAVAVIKQVLLGRYVTINVLESGRGAPSATFRGWLVRLDPTPVGVVLVLRKDPDDRSAFDERPADALWLVRPAFRRAGEHSVAEGPGPLVTEYGAIEAVIAGRDVTPDWAALKREQDIDPIG